MRLRMRFTRIRLGTLLLLLLGAINGVAETVYRWQDAAGNLHFSDTPPATPYPLKEIEISLPAPLYEVEKVIDGDTIVVKNGGKVRLLGINAPEVAHRDRNGEPFGEEAKHRLGQLLDGQRVYLHFDKQRRDRFQRILAYVVREDGSRINEQLLEEGLARALFLQPNMQQLDNYFRMEAGAQQARRGIWSLKEYQVRQASQAKHCIKRFCRLRGRVKSVEEGRDYTYLSLPGKLRVAIHHEQRPQFQADGVDISRLKGKEVVVRGWIGSRRGTPYLQLQHPKQIIVNHP